MLVSIIDRLRHPLVSFLSAPAPTVKRGDVKVIGYHTKEAHKTEEYKPEHTQKYGDDYKYGDNYKYDHDHKYSHDYKYDDDYKGEYFLCQLPPKDVPWYNDYYKWACKHSLSIMTMLLRCSFISSDGHDYKGEDYKGHDYKGYDYKGYDYKKDYGYDYKKDDYKKDHDYKSDYKSDYKYKDDYKPEHEYKGDYKGDYKPDYSWPHKWVGSADSTISCMALTTCYFDRA